MILTDEQLEEIKPYVDSIKEMGENELELFKQKWHGAKEDLEPAIFKWVLGVADDRLIELKKQMNFGHEVESSEVKPGEM